VSTPEFSLLLPVYGGDDPGQFRRAFYSAVHEQRLPPNEVVIVQDGPVGDVLTQQIEEVAARAPVATIVHRIPRNAGLTAALTAGLAVCAHDVIARMDADDVALPDRFARQLPLIADGFDLVGTAIDEFVVTSDGVDRVVGRRIPPLDESAIRASMPFRDPFHHPTVVMRRAAVDRVGGYQPMGLMEDYWLFARMVQAGARVANLPDALVRYRVSSGAYGRRGGWAQLRNELMLQSAMRRSGITTRRQHIRNVVVRGGYRLLPESLRRRAYRRVFVVDP